MNVISAHRLVIADVTRIDTPQLRTRRAVLHAMQEALTLPLLNRDAVLQRLGTLSDARSGEESLRDPFSMLQAIALINVLRSHAADLQRAAECLAEATLASVADVARDAYDLALQQPDLDSAIEVALQPLFDLSG